MRERKPNEYDELKAATPEAVENPRHQPSAETARGAGHSADTQAQEAQSAQPTREAFDPEERIAADRAKLDKELQQKVDDQKIEKRDAAYLLRRFDLRSLEEHEKDWERADTAKAAPSKENEVRAEARTSASKAAEAERADADSGSGAEMTDAKAERLGRLNEMKQSMGQSGPDGSGRDGGASGAGRVSRGR